MFFQSYSPRHKVVIRDLLTGDIKFDISDDLVSLATNKAFGRAAGTWQLMLTYKEFEYDGKSGRYSDHIKPDDLIEISLDAGDGSGFFPVMLGLVDRAARFIALADGKPIRQVKVSGQDMGKLLVKHDIGWDIQRNRLGTVYRQPADFMGPPVPVEMSPINRQFNPALQVGLAGRMITNLFGYTFQRELPEVAKYFYRRYTTDDNWHLVMPSINTLMGCKLWDAMKRAAHEPYNMLSADTDTTKVNQFWITLEKQPINADGKLARSGDKLHTIEDAELIESDLGIGDAERINFLFYNFPLLAQALDLAVDVLMVHPELTRYDEDSIRYHGYCPHTINDDFLPPSMTNQNETPSGDVISDVSMRADLFWSWYQINHELESGTCQIHLRPDIRAGNGLLIKQGTTDKYKEYLIEQVTHRYVVWPRPQFETTLYLTRGQDAPPSKADQAGPPQNGAANAR